MFSNFSRNVITIRSLLLLCCALLPLGALANDAPVSGVGGGVKRLTGKHPSVRMVRETIRMDVYPAYYDVDVTFDFYNDGPACTVKMGFPERGYGGINGDTYRREPSFLRFNTWVDGNAVTARRQQADVGEGGDFLAYWVKDVTFTAGQRRAVRVAYRSNNGDLYFGEHGGYGAQVFGHYAPYHFTGGNWKGLVEQSTLRINLHLPGAYAVRCSEAMTLGKDGLTHLWKHWPAEDEFQLEFYPTRADALVLRGLDLNGYPPYDQDDPGEAMVSSQPGQVPPAWQPPVLLHNGRPFIALPCWADYLNDHHDSNNPVKKTPPRVALAWDDATHTASITQDGRTLHFTLKQPEMVVEGNKSVPLPEGPFLSRPLEKRPGQLSDKHPSQLYVPLQPLVEFFGGTLNIDREKHVVFIKLPPVPAH